MPRGLINSLGILFYIFKTNVIPTQNYQPFDYVFQFADISRPTERLEVVQRLRRNSFARDMILGTNVLDKFWNQKFDILAAFSERRYLNHYYTETVIQVLAEVVSRNLISQILIRSRYNTNINRNVFICDTYYTRWKYDNTSGCNGQWSFKYYRRTYINNYLDFNIIKCINNFIS